MNIVLPWPDSRLSPNAKRRTHWRVYQPVTKKARADAALATIGAAKGNISVLRWELSGSDSIPVTVRFYPPDRRHRDDDGMIGSFKAYRDGIADALEVNDRRFAPQYIFEQPEKPGRIEVTIGGGSGENFIPACACNSLERGDPDACANTTSGPDRNAKEVRHD